MEVHKIIITNFKSIEGPLELDFERIKGFWKIGGEVGAGKTTIGEAILFGLFGDIKDKNNTDIVSWGKKKGVIEVYCTSKGKDIYIKREFRLQGQSPLYVTVDGDEITFTNKRDAQFQLEKEYYDVSKMTLELLCIISFNNFKSLATLNTADSKAFLDQVFGFYILSHYGDLCKEEKSNIEEDINNTNRNISNLNSQIKKITQLSNTQRIEGDINKIKEENKQYKQTIDQLKNNLSNLTSTYQQEINDLQVSLGNIKALGQSKSKEIKFVEQGKCPTCGAPINQDNLENLKKEREVLLDEYKRIYEDIQEKNISYSEEKSKIDILINTNNKSINDNSTLIAKLEEQEKRLKINFKEVDTIKEQIDEQEQILQDQEKNLQDWKMLYNILTNDVRQKILSSFIPILNQSIDFYTKQLHLPYVIQFDENFHCSIKLIGLDREVAIRCLSTGQLKTVDISIIMGVLRTIMSNINFNINLLDELISNMHPDLRDTICTVLKSNLQPGQTVFVISHVDMDEKYFDGIIEAKLDYKEGLPFSTYEFSK